MQQTALDRWLQKGFVYTSKVYCNTLPPELPSDIPYVEASEDSPGRYRYCFTVTNDKEMSELTARLELANITFTSRICENNGTSAKLFNNPNKSFTLQVGWVFLILAIIAIVVSGLPVRVWKHLSAEDPPTTKQATERVESASRPKLGF